MNGLPIETPRLLLELDSLEECRAKIAAMSEADRTQLSADWLARLDAATAPDPWVLGFTMIRREDRVPVGQCGFKGPPTAEGTVEIAYAVQPEQQGRGYATEAAQAMTRFALLQPDVQRVHAHTLPEANASTRVLTKCGFRHLGSVVDPEDGPVWRWEITS